MHDRLAADTTVMTFNIRGSGPEKNGVNSWEKRQALTMGIITTANPDIVGFQEAQFGNLGAYQYSPLQQTYGHILGNNIDYGNFNPIFWKKNRLALDAHGAFWLHPDPDINDKAEGEPATEWDATIIRSATWGVFIDKQNGDKLCVLNTHFDHLSERARVEGAKLVLRRWHDLAQDLPTVITVDMNAGRFIPPRLGISINYTDDSLKQFETAGFIDVFSQLHKDGPKSNTFHNFEGDRYDPRQSHGLWRVDLILAKGLTPTMSEIIKTAQPPLYPSDHYPVLAALR